jgi:hypothetical protein
LPNDLINTAGPANAAKPHYKTILLKREGSVWHGSGCVVCLAWQSMPGMAGYGMNVMVCLAWYGVV